MCFLFSRTIIVGPGLLGGSVGLADRRGHVSRLRVGVVRTRENIPYLLDHGIVDTVVDRLEEAFVGVGVTSDEATMSEPNLIVFAVPVRTIPRLLEQVLSILQRKEFSSRKWIITDVGSTKQEIVEAAGKLSYPENVCYTGSHPIAGSEQSGPQSASAELFDGRVVLVTPSAGTGREELVGEALSLLTKYWERLGSRVVSLSAKEHDSLLAKTSHLPHLVAVALANMLKDDEQYAVGSGFRDMTRLAASNDEIWLDIFRANRVCMVRELRSLIEALDSWKSLLERDDQTTMTTLLQQAGKIRNALGS